MSTVQSTLNSMNNENTTVRYNPENDYIQIYKNGSWQNWRVSGLGFIYKFTRPDNNHLNIYKLTRDLIQVEYQSLNYTTYTKNPTTFYDLFTINYTESGGKWEVTLLQDGYVGNLENLTDAVYQLKNYQFTSNYNAKTTFYVQI